MRSAGEEGVVVVSFVTDDHGVPDTTSISIVQATNEAFASSVRTVLPRWRYSGAGPVLFACRFKISSLDHPRDSTYVSPQFAAGIDTLQPVVVTGVLPGQSRMSSSGRPRL